MTHISLFEAVDYIAKICLAFSILNAILPPYDVLNDFPKAQKYYKLLLAIVKYFSGDVRTHIMSLYPSYQAGDKMQMMAAAGRDSNATPKQP